MASQDLHVKRGQVSKVVWPVIKEQKSHTPRKEQRSTNGPFLGMFMREVASSYEIRSGIWAQYWPGVNSNEKGHGGSRD